MRLTNGVLQAVRGIGAAALIATSVGCTAAAPTPASTTTTASVQTPPRKPASVTAVADVDVHVVTPVAQEVELENSEDPVQPDWRYEDMAAACGRG